MNEVAIIGAGELGGSLAYALARHDTVRQIRLIDEAADVAAGKALDIMQASPIERFATHVVASSDPAAAAGAAIVVIADAAHGGDEWDGDSALLLVKRLFEFDEPAARVAAGPRIVLCAGASQRGLIDRAVNELRTPPRRLVGSAPEALAAAARAIVAIEANGSPQDVSLAILGVPPSHIVVPWEDAAIAGVAMTRVLDDVTRRRVAARIAPLWPPGPLALAAAAVKAIDAIGGRSRAILSCFVGADPSGGVRTRAAALPVRLGPGGVARVELPPLTVHDRVALDNAMQL